MTTARGQIERLIAIRDDSEGQIHILPPYEVTASVGSDSNSLRIWQVTSDLDRARAMQIILRSHYLIPPTRGLILGCRFIDAANQERVRQAALDSNHHDRWSAAWQEEPGEMIACAVLDTMYHGNPKGRLEIAQGLLRELPRQSARYGRVEELLDGDWQEKDRSEVLKTLRVAYASRFAVDAPYRGMGIGTLLAQCLLDVGALYRSPQAEFVEVITTLPSQTADALLSQGDGEHDFLRRAGYKLVEESRPSRPLLQPEPSSGDKIIPVTARKLYYYGKTRRGIQP
jgi:GNAT superfamily N-acetyltransferase